MVAWLQQHLFEWAIEPILFRAGMMSLAEDVFDLTEWIVLGALEILGLALVLGVLERWRPVEPVTDRRAIRVDILYTVLHRLGLFAFTVFALVDPLVDMLEAELRWVGVARPNIDQVWPGVTDQPLVSFAIYVVILDLADYWIHRGQHRIGWWWQLHAVHHSQRQMTFWSDSRNHVLDSLLHDALMALTSVFIGVAPDQFVMLTIFFRLLQNVQHANLRLQFPPWLATLLVSPGFHRLHHAIAPGPGHEATHGCNFAVLFPVWDRLFGTFDGASGFVATGIADQLQGRDYGTGFWSQQWRAVLRWAGRA